MDRWVDPARRPTGLTALRQSRVVVVGSLMVLAGNTLLALTLVLGDAPLVPTLQAVLTSVAVATAVGLVRWGGHVRAAAWVTTLSLAGTPLLQASFDAGIRDPALALAVLAPIAGAMSSGARLALVSTAVTIGGTAVLYLAGVQGWIQPGFSSPQDLNGYALACAVGGMVLSSLAGILYVRNTGEVLAAAEGESTKLDEALRVSEVRYRSLFNQTPVGLYRTAVDGSVLLANPALAHLLGVESPEVVCTLNLATFYDEPADRDRFRSLVDRGGAARRFETRWRRRDGEIRHVRIDAHLTRGDGGEPLYYEGAVEDVTAEREAREALYRSEARFRALVQRSSDVTVVADAEARLTYVSPSVGRLLGYRPDRLLGSSILDLVHPDDRPQAEDFLAHAEAGGSALQVEVRFRHADGHFVFAEGAGTPLYDDEAVGGLVLNLRDVTERKRAQAVLLQAKRQAEEVAALKSTFLANMSHEIRTPLTAILGFSDVLVEELDDPSHREFIGLISRSGRRLMDTLNSVLDLARLEAGSDQLAAERLNVSDLVTEAVQMFQPAAGERGLALAAAIEGGPEAAHEAVADEAALARVVHNLIGNALKFTEEGHITVSLHTEPSGPTGAQVVLRVRDTGIGIDEAFLPRVFGEFEQESSGAERTHEGAGLGLSISRQLVERMGGTIGVESQKGVGTVFTVTLRSVSQEGPEEDARPLALIVDDNDQAREVAERTLAKHYRIARASDGSGALAAVERERPDVALLDIHLGQSITGEEVMRQLRDTPAFADLPIVAVTAYALPGDRERFLAAGFDAYVTKPYTRQHLMESMEEAVRSRAAGAQSPVPQPAAAPPPPAPPALPAFAPVRVEG